MADLVWWDDDAQVVAALANLESSDLHGSNVLGDVDAKVAVVRDVYNQYFICLFLFICFCLRLFVTLDEV